MIFLRRGSEFSVRERRAHRRRSARIPESRSLGRIACMAECIALHTMAAERTPEIVGTLQNGGTIALRRTAADGSSWEIFWQNTTHLASLGAAEIDRDVFLERVAAGLGVAAPDWRFDALYWQELLPTKPPPT